MNAAQETVNIAKCYIGTTEHGGNNRGELVSIFQRAVDGKASGEAWCLCFVQFILKIVESRCGKVSRLWDTEHCRTAWDLTAHSARVSRNDVQPGDLVIWRHGDTSNGHVGIVERVIKDARGEVIQLATIEGNTGDSSFRDGDGVYQKARHPVRNGNMHVLGFIRPFAA
jgi:hypothetical protein